MTLDREAVAAGMAAGRAEARRRHPTAADPTAAPAPPKTPTVAEFLELPPMERGAVIARLDREERQNFLGAVSDEQRRQAAAS